MGEELVTPGARFAHFKGGVYLVLAVAETHDHVGDKDVVYVSLTHGTIVTRPMRLDSRGRVGVAWLDEVRWPDGVTRTRFVPESSLSQSERFQLRKFWSLTP